MDVDNLKKMLSYDPKSGIFTWKTRDDVPDSWNTKYAGLQAGSIDAYGYVVLRICAKTYKAHRIAWLYMTGSTPPDGIEIDHRNGIRSDNSFSNLRLANDEQNAVNARIRHDNRSGVKGVSWHRRIGKWQAQINEHGKRRSLGYFDQIASAQAAYETRAAELHGEFVWDDRRRAHLVEA